MLSKPDISIVVPVFNGSSTLTELYQRTATTLEALSLSYEMIFVDDGSSDKSWSVICQLKENYGARVRGLQLPRNYGQQAATLCGLKNADGNLIVTMDDDLQTAPEEIPKLLQQLATSQADIVFGVYTSLKHGTVHNIGTNIFRYMLGRVAPGFPNGSSYRLIRSDILQDFPWETGSSVSIDPILSWLTANISTVSIDHGKSKNRRSRYSVFKLVTIALKLLVIYSVWPLRLMIWIGFFSALISFGLGLYFIYQKLFVGAALGFSSLIVTITFSTGLILLSMGILGEYILRIYTLSTKRPAFTIKTII
ncbi:MAG: glycosyltransferase family 2 protein [Flavitalea sp.]